MTAIGILVSLLILGAQYFQSKPCEPAPAPAPSPLSPDAARPSRPHRPHRPQPALAQPIEGVGPKLGGKMSPDGAEQLTCDLPSSEKKKNVGGRDGAGLCVFTSIEYAARFQNERALFDLQANMRKEAGGGYPQKVDAMIKKYAPTVAPGTGYIQYEGPDPSILQAAIKSGRLPCITYNGHDPHYSGSIAHMVTLPHLSQTWAVIGDNNFTSDDQYVWMSPDEFLKRWKGGQGGGWAVILLRPPPPAPPHN